MNTPLPDDRLADLVRDAVDDIDPADRLDAIRARTAHSPAHAARRWWYAAGGTVLATAAAVTAFAVVGGEDDAREPGAAHHSHATDPAHTTPFTVQLIPAYYLGETADGWRLFREFHAVIGEDPAAAALETLQSPADDPDYESPWGPGSFDSARLVDGVIEVELGDGVPDSDHPGDDLSRQQVVYTLQGALQTQAPVQFVRHGRPVGEPLDSRPQNDVLNLVSIADPAEGETYEGSFTARGRANSFEATVHWQIEDDGRVVREGFTTAAGWGDRLYPWAAEIDLAGLAEGTYTFVVREDDPTGGSEPGFHPAVDTRTITVG